MRSGERQLSSDLKARMTAKLMQASIRPLQTTDLRIRRISGRHQISIDGRHLVDGVAFGRPYLRRTDRPAVRIPPRKRRRITYHENDNASEDEEINDRQIALRLGFNDLDDSRVGIETDGDEEEESFFDGDDEDLEAELEDLHQDGVQAGADQDERMLVKRKRQQNDPRSEQNFQRSLKGLGLLRLLDENGQPFVGQYDNPLLDEYGQDEPFPLYRGFRTRKRSAKNYAIGSIKSAKHGVQDSSASPERVNRRGSAGSNKSVHFEDAEPATPVTIHESEDSDEEHDDDFEPEEIDESDKENAEPPAQEANPDDVSNRYI